MVESINCLVFYVSTPKTVSSSLLLILGFFLNEPPETEIVAQIRTEGDRYRSSSTEISVYRPMPYILDDWMQFKFLVTTKTLHG